MINIKINQGKNSFSQEEPGRRLDLKNNRKKAPEKKQSFRFWRILCFVLLVLLAGILIKWRLGSSTQGDFLELVPEQKIAYAVVDQEALYSQALPFWGFLKENCMNGTPMNTQICRTVASGCPHRSS